MFKQKKAIIIPLVFGMVLSFSTTISADEQPTINGVVIPNGVTLLESKLAKEEPTTDNVPESSLIPAESEIVVEETIENDEVDETIENNQPNANAVSPNMVAVTGLSPEVILYCKMAAQEFNISEYILESLVYKESRGNVNAKNGSYIGLTQFNPRFYGSAMTATMVTEPSDPQSNVRVCAYQLSQWNAKYNDMYLVLECWNKGEPKAVAQHTSSGTSYSRTIINRATEFKAACTTPTSTDVATETTDNSSSET